jgi:hypothetical protein
VPEAMTDLSYIISVAIDPGLAKQIGNRFAEIAFKGPLIEDLSDLRFQNR